MSKKSKKIKSFTAREGGTGKTGFLRGLFAGVCSKTRHERPFGKFFEPQKGIEQPFERFIHEINCDERFHY
jgi:hypothetical protein